MNHWKISISHLAGKFLFFGKGKLIEEILELKQMVWNAELLGRFQVREKNRIKRQELMK